MKRLVALLVVLLPLSWVAAGCGHSTSSSGTPQGKLSAEQIEKAKKVAQESAKAAQPPKK